MDSTEQTNLWYDSLTADEKEEVFAGLSPDPDLWWETSDMVDKNNLMNRYGNEPHNRGTISR